jgi:hypothetical protein
MYALCKLCNNFCSVIGLSFYKKLIVQTNYNKYLQTIRMEEQTTTVSNDVIIVLKEQDDIIYKEVCPGVLNKHLKERIEWAINKPNDKLEKKKDATIKQQRTKLQNEEKKWGNDMIGQQNNGQWTTILGEHLVRDVLVLLGENPRKPEGKGGFKPDWETDKYIYEVKTSNWWVSGTAGEKVLGTWIKYQNIPGLYGKPLKIVCVANQEYELTHGKTAFFGENVTQKTKEVLELARSWEIEYIKFSDLVHN